MNRRIFATLALCTVLTATASAAEPPALFGLAHLRNESTAQATTYYKWGTGPWHKVVIGQGSSIAFAYPYTTNSKHSPDLLVRIDVDTDGVKYVEHLLSRGQSADDTDARFGHTFVIRQIKGTDTRYIDAVTANAKVRVTDPKSFRPTVK